MDRGALLLRRLGQQQRSVGEVEGRQADPGGDGRAVLLPSKAAGDHQVDHQEKIVFELQNQAFPEPPPQLTNFLEAVKTRKKFALNEQNGHRSATLINLAKIAVQLGRSLNFDPVKQRFVEDDEANRLVRQPMRGPWRI